MARSVQHQPVVRAVVVLLMAGVMAPAAHALRIQEHYDMTERACRRAGFGMEVCRAIATATAAVDYEEWDNYEAHAMREVGDVACVAADAVAERVWNAARTAIANEPAGLGYAAPALGLALHAIQDECTHRGMTEPQHAYYDVAAVCRDDESSPDEAPDAVHCAREQTERIFAAWRGATERREDTEACINGCTAASPTPSRICRFARLSYDWDGVDARWDGSVGGQLVDSFAAGLVNSDRPELCASPSFVPAEPVVIEWTDPSCPLAASVCGVGGRGDGADGGDEIEATMGCHAAGGRGGVGLLLSVLWLARRRRSQANHQRTAR